MWPFSKKNQPENDTIQSITYLCRRDGIKSSEDVSVGDIHRQGWVIGAMMITLPSWDSIKSDVVFLSEDGTITHKTKLVVLGVSYKNDVQTTESS
jgi:hypothetical protein